MRAPVAISTRGMVSTAFPAASEAGVAMLRAGGNAVDAAVAAAWALCVCEPSGSGLGGQTVALVRAPDGRTIVVDGHSRAPAAVSRRVLTRAEQRRGHRACTVPTTPATLEHLQTRFGRLPAARVMEPAIALAEDGYAITRLQRRQLRWCARPLGATPAARRFLDPDGRPFAVGAPFRQPELARALRRIAAAGARDVYEGEIARAIAADMLVSGGLLDAEDLAGAGPPVERKPLVATTGGMTLLTGPPPGGGPVLATALRALDRLGLDADAPPARRLAAMAEVTRFAFAERERRPLLPDDWTPELQAALLAGERDGETTHLCAADAEGGVVSLTQSIQSLFGAKVANPRYGFLYNNYLLTCPRRPHSYRLRGRGIARSNAVPSLVVDAGGAPVLALGAAGSRRIVSSVLQVVAAVVHRGERVDAALDAPRIHARLRGPAWVERDALTPEAEIELGRRGIPIEARPRHSFKMGAVQAIAFGRDGTLVGAADPRREGEPRGL